MHQSIRATFFVLGMVVFGSSAALAQTPPAEPQKWPTVEFTAEGSQSINNDLGRTVAFIELSEASPAELARHVNQKTAEALAIARKFNTVKTNTRGVQTFPIYSKNGTKIESWRMRSEIQLESTDIPALSDLIGQLQSVAAITQLTLLPAPETQQRATDSATVAAIKAFRAKAELVAQTLGKPWRIRTLQLNAMPDQLPFLRPAMMSKAAVAEAAPAPIEAGETLVRVVAQGSIELLDAGK